MVGKWHAIILLILMISVSSCGPATATATVAPSATVTHAPSATATQTTLPSVTPPAPFPLAGRWTGQAVNGTFKMQANLAMASTCQVGQVCGSIDLITIPCLASYTLVNEQNGLYEFQAGDKIGICGTGQDFLQLLPDGTLQYTSRGDYGETKGILHPVFQSTLPSPQSGMVPIIFDDDGSPDGTTALLYLLSNPGVDLKAVGITYGEAHPAVYIQHMGRMLEDFGYTGIPLGVGQDGPLAGSNDFPEWVRQQAGNFWGFPIPFASVTFPVQDSASMIVSVIKSSPEPVTLFFSGPFTNLARALKSHPEIVKNIRVLYYMGGAVYAPGNVHDFYPDSPNVYADWNIYSDPLAAQQALGYGLTIYLIPLDATNQVTITKADTAQWRRGGRTPNFAADMYDMLMDTSKKKTFYIWDLMTSVIMLNPELCSFHPLHLDVITDDGSHSGQMVVTNGQPNVQVCLKPDAEGIRQKLIGVFSARQ